MSLDLFEPPVKQRAKPVVSTPPLSRTRPPGEYVAFGNVEARNGLQESIEIPLLIRALQLPRGGRVLEIGCGRGIALPVLAERLAPSALIGVDIDDALVAAAQRHVFDRRIDARVLEADVRELPFDCDSFDLVIDFGTCYHVSGGTDGSRTALGEIARVLRTGGLFVHETPVAQHLAHPVRSFGRTLPWSRVPALVRDRSAVLWAARRKLSS
ncbi:MAG: class I SAM-dependent methyltransferase [bacterium]